MKETRFLQETGSLMSQAKGRETGLMSIAAVSATATPTPQARTFDPMAGVLSYLVPGLGQLYQGRFGKGLLFLVCLYGMFFYGMHLGNWRNVYVELKERFPANDRPRLLDVALNRIRFAGQVWIGVAAWPAILHHYNLSVPLINKDFQKVPTEDEINELQQKGDKTWDLGWVCTIIAGVLNILVIYDAVAGPAFVRQPAAAESGAPREAAA